MGNGDSNGDYVYQLLELKIIEGLVPNERDLLQLKRVIDNENHENANWLLELLGIQQDSDKIIITRFEEARGTLRSMANNYVSTSTTLGGHQYDEHTFNGMASEQADEDAELACGLPSNEPKKLKTFLKKIGRGLKNIFTKKK